jgi:hypothetical protein
MPNLTGRCQWSQETVSFYGMTNTARVNISASTIPAHIIDRYPIPECTGEAVGFNRVDTEMCR